MSWSLGLDYVKALVWPLFALTLILLFKGKVKDLLDRISSVDTPIGKATFEAQVGAIALDAERVRSEKEAEVESKIEQESPPLGAEVPVESPREAVTGGVDATAPRPTAQARAEAAIPEAVLRQYDSMRMSETKFNELQKMAVDAPAGAVALAWAAVEQALGVVMPMVDVRYRGTGTPSALLARAQRIGMLPGNVIPLAEDLRQMRNRVLHEGDVVLTPAGATSYVQAAKDVVDALALEWLRRELDNPAGEGDTADTP